jgi:RimJ/RimL family protein N-acetyltransferase
MLNGERVVLRPTTPEDYPALYAWRIDPEVWQAKTARPLRPMVYQEFHDWYEGVVRDEKVATFAVDVDGTLVGRAGLFGIDELSRNGEIGLAFGPEHRGKGYGRDAVRVLVDFAFTHRNLRRVWLECLATNTAALRAYAAAGFVEEGRLREHAWVKDTYVDMVRMAVLRGGPE